MASFSSRLDLAEFQTKGFLKNGGIRLKEDLVFKSGRGYIIFAKVKPWGNTKQVELTC